eukprot:206348-Rhodomonas_salina.2
MDQTPHSKVPSSAERGNWLGSGVKDEKLAFADLIDGRYGAVQPHEGWKRSLQQASGEDHAWQANAKHMLSSLSRGKDGLEAGQGSWSNESAKQNVRQVYFHPHLPGADPSPSGNPQPEWLVRRTQPDFVRADQLSGPSIIRTEFPKATVLHAEISQERLEFLLEIESKVRDTWSQQSMICEAIFLLLKSFDAVPETGRRERTTARRPQMEVERAFTDGDRLVSHHPQALMC